MVKFFSSATSQKQDSTRNVYNDFLFNNLKSIVNNKNLKLKEKQILIEKTFKIINFNKSLKQFDLNPLWETKIILIFEQELKEFEKKYNNIFKNKENVTFENLKKALYLEESEILSYKKMFSFTLYLIMRTPEIINDGSLKQTNFRHVFKKEFDDLYLSMLFEKNINFYQKIFLKDLVNFKLISEKKISNFVFNTNRDLKLEIEEFFKLKKINNFSKLSNFQKLTAYLDKSKNTVITTDFEKTFINLEESEKIFNFFNTKFNTKFKNFKSLLLFHSKLKINDKFTQFALFFSENLIDILLNINVLEKMIDFSSVYNSSTLKTQNILIFKKNTAFEELTKTFFLISSLPMIYPPKNWVLKKSNDIKIGGYLLNDGYFDVVRSNRKGESSYNLSKETVDSINLLQKKKYIISKNTVEFYTNPLAFEYIIKKQHEILNLRELDELKKTIFSDFNKFKESFLNLQKDLSFHKRIKELDDGFKLDFLDFLSENNSDNNYDFKFFHNLSKIFKPLKDFFLEKNENGIEEILNNENYLNCIKLKNQILKNFKKLKTNKSKLMWLEFIIDIIKIFKDQILYFPSFFDFRLRIYPNSGWSFSRTTGAYKHILSSFESFEVKPETNYAYKWGNYIEYSDILYNYFAMSFVKKVPVGTCWDGGRIKFFNKENKDPLVSKQFTDLYEIWDDGISDFFDFKIPLKIKSPTEPEKSIVDIVVFDVVRNSENPLWKWKDSKNPVICCLIMIEVIQAERFFSNPANVGKSYKSHFIIHFDQSSSGPQLYSFLTGDYTTSFFTNITSGDFKQDVYLYFLDSFNRKVDKSLNNDKIEFKDLEQKEDFYKFLKFKDTIFDRKFSKLIVMPFFYGLTTKGIFEKVSHLIKIYIEEHNDLIINDFVSLSWTISSLINTSLKEIFPEIVKFMTKLSELGLFFAEHSIPITFETLDGSLITFSYKEKIKKQTKVKVGNSLKTITYYSYSNEHDSEKTKLAVSPNFIHSLDAAISRIIINEFYFRTGNILEPIHDAFGCNPVDSMVLLDIINEIYLKVFIGDEKIIEKLIQCIIVEPNRSKLNKNQKIIFDDLITSLKKLTYRWNIDTIELKEQILKNKFMFSF